MNIMCYPKGQNMLFIQSKVESGMVKIWNNFKAKKICVKHGMSMGERISK